MKTGRTGSIIAAMISVFVLSFSAMAEERLTIVGTGDGVAILNAVGEAYAKKTGTEVVVPKSIGSSGGIKAVGEDRTPLGRIAGGIKDKEKPYGLTSTPFVKIPTVFFVHSSVNVDGITATQVIDIFSGETTNWKDVGGGDGEISVVRREDGDSSLNNLQSSFPGFKELAITEKARTAEKTPEMIKTISNLENSIGFGPLDVAVANGLKVLKIDGKAPTDPQYPTRGTIFLIYKKANFTGEVKSFVEFATSEEAAAPIQKAGGIPYKE